MVTGTHQAPAEYQACSAMPQMQQRASPSQPLEVARCCPIGQSLQHQRKKPYLLMDGDRVSQQGTGSWGGPRCTPQPLHSLKQIIFCTCIFPLDPLRLQVLWPKVSLFGLGTKLIVSTWSRTYIHVTSTVSLGSFAITFPLSARAGRGLPARDTHIADLHKQACITRVDSNLPE